MADPHIAQRGPYVVVEEPGSKAWCACGLSQKQPYCDGSHAGTGLTPMVVKIEQQKRVAWCGCKWSERKPFCDGSHGELPGE